MFRSSRLVLGERNSRRLNRARVAYPTRTWPVGFNRDGHGWHPYQRNRRHDCIGHNRPVPLQDYLCGRAVGVSWPRFMMRGGFVTSGLRKAQRREWLSSDRPTLCPLGGLKVCGQLSLARRGAAVTRIAARWQRWPLARRIRYVRPMSPRHAVATTHCPSCGARIVATAKELSGRMVEESHIPWFRWRPEGLNGGSSKNGFPFQDDPLSRRLR